MKKEVRNISEWRRWDEMLSILRKSGIISTATHGLHTGKTLKKLLINGK